MNVTDLRKAFTAQGIKGFSSANRAAFNAAIEAAEVEAYAEDAARKPVAVPAAKKNLCPICDLRRKYTGAANGEEAPRLSDMCNPCYAEGGWENSHSDANHDGIKEIVEHAGDAQLSENDKDELLVMGSCWICHPELNLAQKAPKAGKSRAGMVIVAKGTEIHKSATFKAAAEAAGWTVTIETQDYEDGDATNTRHYATARKGQESISLAWDGRAYDYAASSAEIKGKTRKVRNLKEALRFL